MGEPCKVSEVLPEPVSSGVPGSALFVDLTRILDKVMLSCAVWQASTQMASSLSRTPPLLVRSFRRRNDSLSLRGMPILIAGRTTWLLCDPLAPQLAPLLLLVHISTMPRNRRSA
jgi:hypothetical protein